MISKSIRELRVKRGLTQAQLAKKIGVTQTRICNMETRDFNYTLRTLKRLAMALRAKLEVSMH